MPYNCRICIIFLLIGLSNNLPAQNLDSLVNAFANGGFIHIATHSLSSQTESEEAWQIAIDQALSSYLFTDNLLNFPTPQLVVLSLVDPDLYKNWDKKIEKFAASYKQDHLLLAVSAQDSRQRTAFMREFYRQQGQIADLKKAYDKTVEMIQAKYPTRDFKHYFHLKKDH